MFSFDKTDQNRHSNMVAIKSKNTKPELMLRKHLFALGFRYRLYGRNLPGNPDIVFSRKKAVIFVNGCFWHHHAGCSRATFPKSNKEYWIPKIKRNAERDHKNTESLISLGWRVLIVWECALKKDLSERTSFLVADWLKETFLYSEITNIEGYPCLINHIILNPGENNPLRI